MYAEKGVDGHERQRQQEKASAACKVKAAQSPRIMLAPALIKHTACVTTVRPSCSSRPFIIGALGRVRCCTIFSGVYYVNALPGSLTIDNVEVTSNPPRIKRCARVLLPPAAAVGVRPAAVSGLRRAGMAGVFGRVDDVGRCGGGGGGVAAHGGG
jgi:hypothetical protein